MRKRVASYKPPPPPQPRYKARQEPLVVYVTFLLCQEERLMPCRAAVLVPDFLAARTWARRAFSAGLVVCREGPSRHRGHPFPRLGVRRRGLRRHRF